MRSLLIAAAGSLVLALASVAPAAAPAEDDPLTWPWRWVEFGARSGLPSDRVFEIVETSDGVPWVVTDRGLAWYDGFRWHAVDVTGWTRPWREGYLVPGLADEMLVGDRDRIFRGNADGFVPLDLPIPVARAVALSESGYLLATREGLFRHYGETLTPFEKPPGTVVLDPIFGIFQTREGGVGVRTITGTHAWVAERWVHLIEGHVDFVSIRDDGGTLGGNNTSAAGIWNWDGPVGVGGVERLSGDGISAVRAMDLIDGVNGVACYESGRVRVCREGRWEWLTEVPLQLANPRTLRLQRNGDLWVAGERGLFLHANRERWTSERLPGPDGANQINELLLSSTGDLWVATSAGVYVKRAGESYERIAVAGEQPLQTVTGLCEDAEGGIWASSGLDFPGAYRFHEGAWRHYGRAEGLLAQRVHRIVQEPSGTLWFLGISDRSGMDEPGAFAFDGERFEPWGIEQGVVSGRVYAVAEGPEGELWFATAMGLSRFKDEDWTYWTSTSGLAYRRVFCLARGTDGRIWFGHSTGIAGLGFVDGEDQVRYLTVADGLVDDNVRDLRLDPEERLWITTAGGLSVYRDGRFASLHRAEGLDHPNLWPVLPAEDRVYVGTIGAGLRVLSLEEEADPAPRVELRAEVHGSDVRVGWDASAWRGALAPERIETRYRLDDGVWSPWARTRELDLSGAGPGEHTLRVEAKGLLGAVAEDGAAITLDVPSPLHRSPLFLAALPFAITGVLAWAFVSTKRRLRQRELLRESEERHRRLIEEIPLCIHEIDLAGRLASMNPAGLRMLDVQEERAVVGADYFSLIAPEDQERVRGLFAQARSGSASQFEFTAIIGDERRTFESSFVPLRGDDGAVTKLMGYSLETTERTQADEARRQLERQFRVAQKMEAVALLAGGVAHDFNNLLTVIGGHASLIEAEPGRRDVVRESSSEILKAQERAAALTRQLLALGRRQLFQPRVLDLRAIVTDMEDMMRRLIGEQIELSIEVGEHECRVVADPGQIEQILLNLVVNARDAMPDGGVLTVSCTQRELARPTAIGGVRIDAGRYSVLTVLDTGVGMDADTRQRIFEPFFTTKGFESGTGLGLSTVHGIVEQSGGWIAIESEPGAGAEFSIFLPATERAVEPATTDRGSAERVRGAETLLVAEDDPSILQLVCMTLEDLGYTVLAASDGTEALETLRRFEGAVHLLLTDVVMPGMGGRALAKEFRALHPKAGVLFMTGYADAPDWRPTLPVLSKPFTPSELAARVRAALGKVASPAPA